MVRKTTRWHVPSRTAAVFAIVDRQELVHCCRLRHASDPTRSAVIWAWKLNFRGCRVSVAPLLLLLLNIKSSRIDWRDGLASVWDFKVKWYGYCILRSWSVVLQCCVTYNSLATRCSSQTVIFLLDLDPSLDSGSNDLCNSSSSADIDVDLDSSSDSVDEVVEYMYADDNLDVSNDGTYISGSPNRCISYTIFTELSRHCLKLETCRSNNQLQ